MTESQSQNQTPLDAVFKCPHCGYQQVVHIRASEVVTIYNCPKCGQLVAPVKSERR